jgi:hypothetical protein
MEDVIGAIKNNWQFISAVLGLLLGWFDLKARFNMWLNRLDREYESAKKWAKSKDLHQAAKTAYGVVSKIARQTENGIDDKVAKGLEEAIKIMEHLGWDKNDLSNGEKDVIRSIFDALHENEHLQLESSLGVPVSNKLSGAGQIAAPLSGSGSGSAS